MFLTRIVLSIIFVLFASTALAGKPEKMLVCHVGNELGSMGETYMDNPDCTIPPEWEGEAEDYKCPDAGKIDLILVSKKAKHIGNESHSFGIDFDYAPVIDGVGDAPADFEDNTSPLDGIDDGCETEEPCPCWTADELAEVADGFHINGMQAENVRCSGDAGLLNMYDYTYNSGTVMEQALVQDSATDGVCQYRVWEDNVQTAFTRLTISAGELTEEQFAACVTQLTAHQATRTACTE